MKKNGLWMEINDGLVPTRSKMDGLNTQIEVGYSLAIFPLLMEYSSQIPINFSFHCQMSLPVIFVPNFSASDISKLGGQFEFVDPLNAQRPICPLFGAGNNQVGHFFTFASITIYFHRFCQYPLAVFVTKKAILLCPESFIVHVSNCEPFSHIN